jgi:hypothetical protein
MYLENFPFTTALPYLLNFSKDGKHLQFGGGGGDIHHMPFIYPILHLL